MNMENTAQDRYAAHALPPGVSLLRGQYLIEEFLDRGGFGMTYLARDSLEREVVVKECFPASISCRVEDAVHPLSSDHGRRYRSMINHFLREARRLAALDHPNIVGVHQVFEENNTAYMALDYVAGADLLTVAETQPQRLTPALIQRCLVTVLEAVCYIHEQGMLHRDISPDNILLGPDDHLTLIDFGAAREQVGRESRMLTVLLAVKDGYSPQEFYQGEEAQFTSSDLYSIGATFYHLLTGAPPPHSQTRMAALAANRADPYVPLAGRVTGYDAVFLGAIDRALSVLPGDRMGTACDWLTLLGCPVPQPAKADPDAHHASLAEAPGEADIRRSISRMVAESQEVLSCDPAEPAQPPGAPEAETTEAARSAAAPAVPVDLFGNPIEDVDAWLNEQEQLIRARAVAARTPCALQHEDAPQDRPAGLISRGLSALRLSRRRA